MPEPTGPGADPRPASDDMFAGLEDYLRALVAEDATACHLPPGVGASRQRRRECDPGERSEVGPPVPGCLPTAEDFARRVMVRIDRLRASDPLPYVVGRSPGAGRATASEVGAVEWSERAGPRHVRLGREILARFAAGEDVLTRKSARAGGHRPAVRDYVHDLVLRLFLRDRGRHAGGTERGEGSEFKGVPTCDLIAELVGLTPGPARQGMESVLRDVRRFTERCRGIDRNQMAGFEDELAKALPAWIDLTNEALDELDGTGRDRPREITQRPPVAVELTPGLAEGGLPTRLYSYVGPDEPVERTLPSARGTPVTAPDDVARWSGQSGQTTADGALTAAFVVDGDGVLLVADRRCGHVACAGGRPVRAAGEMTVVVRGGSVEVRSVSNLSPAYRPGPESWPAVEAALRRARLAPPAGFSPSCVFRMCVRCRGVNPAGDGTSECEACRAASPATGDAPPAGSADEYHAR